MKNIMQNILYRQAIRLSLLLILASSSFAQHNKFNVWNNWLTDKSTTVTRYSATNFEITKYDSSLSYSLSTAQLVRLDTLVSMLKDSLVTDSLSKVFDLLYIMANESGSAALRNLALPDSFAGTAVDNPTFTQWEGYAADGTTPNYINTNHNASTQGAAYTLNSASFGYYSRTNLALDVNIIGASDGSAYIMSVPRRSNDTFRSHINQAITTSTAVANNDSRGFFIVSRELSNDGGYYKNGVELSSFSYASTAIPNYNMYVLTTNNSGTSSNGSTRQLSIAFFGRGLTATEIGKLTNCIEWYMDDLGKGVIP